MTTNNSQAKVDSGADSAVNSGLEPRKAFRALACILASCFLAAATTFVLPHDRYVRWQQAQSSIMFHTKWIYERIRFDKTPIDVAIVGSSKVEAGISPLVLSRHLKQQLGRDVNVANLSLVQPGRDFAFEIVKELVEFHPEVKLLVLGYEGEVVNSHAVFKYVADPQDLVGAPLLFNTKYFANVLFLLYRNISYAAQTFLPGIFRVQTRFDSRSYLGIDLDRTLGYKTPTNEYVNGDQTAPVDELVAVCRRVQASHSALMRWLGHLPVEMAFAIDRTYVRRIAELANQRGIAIAFVALPTYEPSEDEDDRFYRQHGPVLRSNGIALQPRYFANGTHLNRTGAELATEQLASAILSLPVRLIDAK